MASPACGRLQALPTALMATKRWPVQDSCQHAPRVPPSARSPAVPSNTFFAPQRGSAGYAHRTVLGRAAGLKTLCEMPISALARHAIRFGKYSRRIVELNLEAQRLIDERPSLSSLSKDITAAIVLLECAEAKLFNRLPMDER
jgi:hypothetical protein